ncbi:hypothetical protein B0A50_03557 [Salinomyces thailandicus]|uniref:Uncharacterized protein n=1 Tax=Salinomyces thailandicus TaxID=706561 RepID=A0A4U0U407_9PEZI|nr:hypothetical protein B0A50_03557 [Salinomyces thailandica]
MSEPSHPEVARSSRTSSFDSFIAYLQSSNATISIGRSAACEEGLTDVLRREYPHSNIQLHHPLLYSDVCDLSSTRLWWLQRRLRELLATADKQASRRTIDAETVARLNSFMLIDFTLKAKVAEQMLKPSLSVDHKVDTTDGDVPPLDLNADSRPFSEPALAANSSRLTLDLRRATSSPVDQTPTKEDQFLSLARGESESDSDIESDLSRDVRTQLLGSREDRRIKRLIRDRSRPTTPTQVPCRPDEDLLMSGVFESSASDYLGGGHDGLVGEPGYDAALQANKLKCWFESAQISPSMGDNSPAQPFKDRAVKGFQGSVNSKWPTTAFWKNLAAGPVDAAHHKLPDAGQGEIQQSAATRCNAPCAALNSTVGLSSTNHDFPLSPVHGSSDTSRPPTPSPKDGEMLLQTHMALTDHDSAACENAHGAPAAQEGQSLTSKPKSLAYEVGAEANEQQQASKERNPVRVVRERFSGMFKRSKRPSRTPVEAMAGCELEDGHQSV